MTRMFINYLYCDGDPSCTYGQDPYIGEPDETVERMLLSAVPHWVRRGSKYLCPECQDLPPRAWGRSHD